MKMSVHESWVAQNKQAAFLNSVQMAADVQLVKRLGEACDWPSVKNFYEKYGRSPLHLAVTMLDRCKSVNLALLLVNANKIDLID